MISETTKEETDTKKNTSHLYPRTDLNTNLRKIRSKILKFKANLSQQHKRNTSPSLHCSRKKRMTTKTL
jgi:hypothetical protein